jgi:hypothetical protein
MGSATGMAWRGRGADSLSATRTAGLASAAELARRAGLSTTAAGLSTTAAGLSTTAAGLSTTAAGLSTTRGLPAAGLPAAEPASISGPAATAAFRRLGRCRPAVHSPASAPLECAAHGAAGPGPAAASPGPSWYGSPS